MKDFTITVKRITPFSNLHPEDRDFKPWGSHFVRGMNEEHALDEFHATVPIACLDDFEISIELNEPPTVLVGNSVVDRISTEFLGY